MHRFRLVHKNQLNNLNFESYWLVDLKFRAPDWSKFKLFSRIYDWFGCNRNLCSTLTKRIFLPNFSSYQIPCIKLPEFGNTVWQEFAQNLFGICIPIDRIKIPFFGKLKKCDITRKIYVFFVRIVKMKLCF